MDSPQVPRRGQENTADPSRTDGGTTGSTVAADTSVTPARGETEPIYTTLSPAMAALFSIFPGAGQVYCGRTRRGIAFLVGTFVGTLFLLLPGIVVWLWGIVDASRIACMVNSGDVEPRELKRSNIAIYLVALVVIGTVLAFVLTFYLLLVIGLSTAW